ncbi:MAG TPA: hypothetical protein VLC48_11030 [Gemmatimonadota bacterium]|nr:hypothetical protein [Gemmatimonadota bacterium]
MKQSYPLVEIHYALWGVLTVPLGFAGVFFLLPGLMLVEGFTLQAIAGVILFYLANLTRLKRPAWLFGLLLHGALIVAAVYYLPRLPQLLGVPLLLLNAYSLIVLLIYRKLWSGEEAARQEALLA